MSNAVYPSLPGLAIDVMNEIEFSTLIQRAASGKELRIGQRAYPLYNKKLKYNFLRDNSSFPELAQLGGFYLQRQGAADSFLFSDPDDGLATAQVFGVPNDVQTQFQLVRNFGGFVEPVFYINGGITITRGSDGAVLGGYTFDANTGVVTFTVAPPSSNVTLKWTGNYYFRARFLDDRFDFKKFLYQVWEKGTVSMVASLQDKLL